jgi:hypothetical protein
VSNAPLTLDDIADARAYEREREAFRSRIIDLKKIRRIPVGPVVSLVFENRDTIRFQVQEMARAEKLQTDAAIQSELDTYNPLLPGPGRLAASLFIELTSRAEMERWLPRLVGIETAVQFVIGSSGEVTSSCEADTTLEVVRCEVDPGHAANLTRQETTAAVHFVYFSFAPIQVERFRRGHVSLAVDHPNYRESVALSPETRASLLADLLG